MLSTASVEQLKSGAMAMRNAGDFAGAEAMFRRALTIAPNDLDCVHMLGVLCFRTGRAREAMHLFSRAGMLSNWQVPAVRLNFGFAAGAVHGEAITQKRIAYQVWQRARHRDLQVVNPLVSVVVPSYNHARFVVDCLESVYCQSWRHIELIVIDDGSTDESVALIRQSLVACPFPHQFVAHENRGAHATINKGVALAHGEFINVLNSDDRFLPTRIEKLVTHVAGSGADWGFAGVNVIDDLGAPAAAPEGSLAAKLNINAATIDNAPTIGFAMLRHNVAISTGNLFVRTRFFNEIGGFADLRYVHDWEFVLRATLASEPVYVAEKLYEYRIHGSNTINEAPDATNVESSNLLRRTFQSLRETEDATNAKAANPFAPTRANWGEYVGAFGLQSGFGALLTAGQLTVLAQSMITDLPPMQPTIMAPLRDAKGVRDVFALLQSMSAVPDGIHATFVQHQRYGIIARAIEQLRASGQIFTILEVGADTDRVLGRLLPHDNITYLDRELPPGAAVTKDVMIGDATQLKMPDGAFDLVVAPDVFEHIDPARRNEFLRHICRVARVAAMLAAPFDSEGVRRAEDSVSAFWHRLFAQPYRWRAEHADNGLPSLSATEKTLQAMGMKYVHFGHGDLTLWCEMLKAHFAAVANGQLRGAVSAIERHYRDHLLERDVANADTYRQVLLCTREPAVMHTLSAFYADLASHGGLPDLVPLYDVLHACQNLAFHR